jgi:hypothetical protein
LPSAGAPSKEVMVYAVGGDLDDLVLAELDRLPGVPDERRPRRCQEGLALADADHQRGVAPRADDHVGCVRVDGDQGERAVEAAADRRIASASRPPSQRANSRPSRCATTSVSVSLRSSTPARAARRAARRSSR